MNNYKLDGTKYFEYLSNAYTFFNEELFKPTFGVLLNPVIITLSHKASARGYYWHNIFKDTSQDLRLPELSITYNSLFNTTEVILSTLAHEMTHVYEYQVETYSKTAGYHNVIWAGYMVAIGLKPYSIYNEAKMTGTKVSHTIIPNGPFQQRALEFINEHGDFPLAQNIEFEVQTIKVKQRSYAVCDCGMKFSVPKNTIDNVDFVCKTCNSPMGIVENV
jgi:predicted SprT family Zn-dependent metalloprotease